jgi:hypothetical protein
MVEWSATVSFGRHLTEQLDETLSQLRGLSKDPDGGQNNNYS